MLSFEVVLADSSVVRADQSSYPDLYRCLRGGGANFGIVTDVELIVHPYQGMWGGSMNWSLEQSDAIIDAFVEYGEDNVNNVDAAVLLGLINYQGQWVWHVDVENLKSTPPDEKSPLRKLLLIPSSLDNNTGPTSQAARTDSIVGHYPPGSHNGYWTFCTKVDKRIIKFFMDTWREEVNPILTIPGMERSALADVNFVTQNIIDAMNARGGNILGLANTEPFLIFLMEPFWTDESQSERVWEALRATATKTQAEAKRLGKQHNYIYLNYANPFQDVYGSYGPGSKAFLNAVSSKYDPDGIFQHQRKAGWHLGGPLWSSRVTSNI